MGAPFGNKFGVKLKKPDVRQEAYQQYCDHIASGYPKEAFFFKHPTHSVTWATMERYIRDNPDEFSSLLMAEAKAKRYKYWFEVGKDITIGRIKRNSPVTWANIMRNSFKEYGWDQEVNKIHEVPEEFISASDKISQQIFDFQKEMKKVQTQVETPLSSSEEEFSDQDL